MATHLRKYCLARSTYVEALVNNWYAYAHTMAPAPAALHLVNYQLKVLRSYLDNPSLHAAALSNKKLLGGPFVAIEPTRSAAVRSFYQDMVGTQRETQAFANAVLSFQSQLSAEARGLSIEPFYDRLPAAMRGLCELGYDYHCRPIVRFIEPLLYRSAVAAERIESWALCRQETDSDRAFFLSTPRLPSSGAHHWAIGFNDQRVNELFALETAPRPLGAIAELLGAEGNPESLLPFLSPSDDSPPMAAVWRERRPRIRYFGHACLLIEHAGVSILTDPNIPVSNAGGGTRRLSYPDLPPHIDFVLVTHAHADHFLPEVLARLRRRIGVVVVPRNHGVFWGDVSLRILVRRLGIPVMDVEPHDEVPMPDGRIVALPFLGEHSDLLHAKTAYLVQVGGRTIFIGADSNCLDARIYGNIRAEYGPVDAAFLGMECAGAPLRWQYGALLPDQVPHEVSESRRLNGCNARGAVSLFSALEAQRAFVYAMGREPWLEYLLALAPSDDSLQMVESTKALAEYAARGAVQCENLFGPYELLL